MTAREAQARPPSRETVAEAAAWITRLHSSRRSPEVEAGLRSWLAADEQNAYAFESMTEIWESMPAVAESERPRTVWDKPALARYLPLGTAALLGCAVAGSAVFMLMRAPSYATEIGEQRIVNLDDGSRVSLNSSTRMAIDYGQSERRIELKDGEAFFEVAREANRPFVVIAGSHRVTALGTSFSVRYDGERTTVSLVDGKVAVASGQAAEQPTTLISGQRLTFSERATPLLDQPRMETVTAWRRGEVILDETMLADAIAEMNRYDKTPLVIDTPAIAALPVSGIYRSGDSPGFARIVAQMYGLQVAEENGSIHLRR